MQNSHGIKHWTQIETYQTILVSKTPKCGWGVQEDQDVMLGPTRMK